MGILWSCFGGFKKKDSVQNDIEAQDIPEDKKLREKEHIKKPPPMSLDFIEKSLKRETKERNTENKNIGEITKTREGSLDHVQAAIDDVRKSLESDVYRRAIENIKSNVATTIEREGTNKCTVVTDNYNEERNIEYNQARIDDVKKHSENGKDRNESKHANNNVETTMKLNDSIRNIDGIKKTEDENLDHIQATIDDVRKSLTNDVYRRAFENVRHSKGTQKKSEEKINLKRDVDYLLSPDEKSLSREPQNKQAKNRAYVEEISNPFKKTLLEENIRNKSNPKRKTEITEKCLNSELENGNESFTKPIIVCTKERLMYSSKQNKDRNSCTVSSVKPENNNGLEKSAMPLSFGSENISKGVKIPIGTSSNSEIYKDRAKLSMHNTDSQGGHKNGLNNMYSFNCINILPISLGDEMEVENKENENIPPGEQKMNSPESINCNLEENLSTSNSLDYSGNVSEENDEIEGIDPKVKGGHLNSPPRGENTNKLIETRSEASNKESKPLEILSGKIINGDENVKCNKCDAGDTKNQTDSLIKSFSESNIKLSPSTDKAIDLLGNEFKSKLLSNTVEDAGNIREEIESIEKHSKIVEKIIESPYSEAPTLSSKPKRPANSTSTEKFFESSHISQSSSKLSSPFLGQDEYRQRFRVSEETEDTVSENSESNNLVLKKEKTRQEYGREIMNNLHDSNLTAIRKRFTPNILKKKRSCSIISESIVNKSTIIDENGQSGSEYSGTKEVDEKIKTSSRKTDEYGDKINKLTEIRL